MSQPEENKKVVERYVEAFNRGDLEELKALFTAGAVVHGVLGWGGMDKVIPMWRELHEAFGIVLTVDEMIAEGDRVAVRYTERGTFRGAFRGHPPTGKFYELIAMEWFVLKNGFIQKRWGARDFASQSRQMEMKF